MLKTIKGLQGVNILSKDAQKKIAGGTVPAGGTKCGVVLFNSAGNASSFWWATDTNGNGKTREDAIFEMSTYNAANPGGYYTAHWCCAQCVNYA